MSLFWMIVVVLAFSGVLFAGVGLVWTLPAAKGWRIREAQARKVTGKKLWARVFGNMVFSSALVFALTYLASPWLIADDETPLWRAVLDASLILLIYDFFYYWMHRSLFHAWKPMRSVHAVHHVVRAPTAIESLYLHPLENFLGLALLTITGCILGPVAPLTYGITLLVHSSLNILVHAGLDIPFFGFRALSYLSRKHAIHHVSMRGGNYASLTPLWDIMFGTAE